MKSLKIGLGILAGALLMLGYQTSKPQAFHSGGVAECAGCHSMHSPADRTLGKLLIKQDQSSTCLSCHMSSTDTGPNGYHVSTVDSALTGTGLPLQRTPGGDFGWLKKTYTYTENGAPVTEDGATHGHNIVAVDYGYTADPSKPTAPGGTFSSSQLACNSCHDPHGKYRRTTAGTVATSGEAIWASGSYPTATIRAAVGTSGQPGYVASQSLPAEPRTFATGENLAVGVYRLLAGNGYSYNDGQIIPGFTGVPAAKAPSTYNQSEGTNQVRVAYGNVGTTGHSTWGNWCGTCHPAMHSSGNYVHPVDVNLQSTLTRYNSYVKSGDVSGTQTTSYLSLVPFVEGGGVTYPTLASHAANNSPTYAGPIASDQVSCVSCHRSHASGFMDMLRFDTEYEFMTKEGDYVGLDNPAIGYTGRGPVQARGRMIADWKAAYYDRPATRWSAYQRVLCNKCHAQD